MNADETRIGELERSLKRKRQFIIDSLHQIRTPLAGIRSLAELARGHKSEEPVHHRLDLILESTDELRRLVNDLLQIERLEAGEIVYEFVHFNLGDVLREVTPLAEALLEESPEIRFEVEVPPDLPPVHGDVRAIRQVLVNFLDNAIQFTRAGSVRVRARKDGDYVRVNVEDSGVGIAEDEKEIVWEQFRQAGGAISPAYEGLGLGLSMNKRIIEQHRGDIGVDSQIGEGSKFWFLVPTCESGILPAMKRVDADGRHEPHEVTWETPPSSESRSLVDVLEAEEGIATPERPAPVLKEARYRETATGHGAKVLIVDESPVSIEILRELLVGHGYAVVVAPDGPTALDRLAKEAPDLILTELWLPEMSGFDLVKHVREREESETTPIILLTARRNREDIGYGLNLGADDYVQKPFDRGELLARIGVLIRLKKAREDLRDLNLDLEEKVRKRTLELAAAYERLYLSEKLSGLGLLTAGIAHELNNPLAYSLANVELVRSRLAARETLRRIRRIRTAGGDDADLRDFLDEIEREGPFAKDVRDFREDSEELPADERPAARERFFDWLEQAAEAKGGAKDLFANSDRLLDSAEEGLQRARKIVRDLSAFSHPGTDEEGAVDLSASAERTLTILKPAIREKGVRVEKTLTLDRPVRGISGRIDQVLMNLLQNAIHASPPGGTIRVRTLLEDERGRFEVEDEGPGISPADHAHVFDPFFTTKPVGEGTGLGLSICYRIVEGLAGEIRFRSREGGGTTFYMRLPLASREETM